MNLLAKAGGFSFAHLGGLGGRPPAAKRRAEDEREKDKEEATKRRAETEDDDEKDKEEAKRRAEDEKPEHYEDDGKGKSSESEEDENEAKHRAGAESEEDEDDRRREADNDDEEMKKAKAAGFAPALAAARRAERRRVGRILSAPEAASRIATAAHLACNTSMSSAAAIGLLRTVPAAAAKPEGALARAMAGVKHPSPGGDGPTKADTPVSRLNAATEAVVKDIEKRNARRFGRA